MLVTEGFLRRALSSRAERFAPVLRELSRSLFGTCLEIVWIAVPVETALPVDACVEGRGRGPAVGDQVQLVLWVSISDLNSMQAAAGRSPWHAPAPGWYAGLGTA